MSETIAMSWREKVVLKILLLIAAHLAENADLKKEVQGLATHINVYAR